MEVTLYTHKKIPMVVQACHKSKRIKSMDKYMYEGWRNIHTHVPFHNNNNNNKMSNNKQQQLHLNLSIIIIFHYLFTLFKSFIIKENAFNKIPFWSYHLKLDNNDNNNIIITMIYANICHKALTKS